MLIKLNDLNFEIRFYRQFPYTWAELWDSDIILVGEARCSDKDRFEKSKSRKIALAKLLQKMGKSEHFSITKEDRTNIWNKYFEEHKK